MIITLTPVRMDATLDASVSGNVLTLNGAMVDFGQLTDGDVLPGDAVSSEWVTGPVTRDGTDIKLTLIAPHGPNAGAEARSGGTATIADNGDVMLPSWGADAPAPVSEVITVDWTQMQSAADIASEQIAIAREGASLSKTDFAIALMGAGLITSAEANAWLSSGTLPSAASTALASIPTAQRTEAELRFRGANEIDRTNPLISILAAGASLTDAQVDALFGIA